MEQTHISCGSVCDPLQGFVKFLCLVAQKHEPEKCDTKDETLCTMHDPKSLYRWKRPELLGKCIRGCFHGWMILSNETDNGLWSLWNPVTSKTICLPPLSFKDGDFESITQCCLSSPPNDRTSVLMLTRANRATIVLCQLGRKRKRLRWKEMTYAKQLRNIIGDNGFLHCLTCYDGKVCALVSDHLIVIQVDFVVKDKEDVVSLLSLGEVPFPFHNGYSSTELFLKGYCNDLFYIKLDFDRLAKNTLGAVYLFKLNMTSMIWEEMENLKDAIILVILGDECSVFYRNAISSELGGYAHILGGEDKVVHSYDVKDKTISLSCQSCLEHVECRLHGDHGETECETAEDGEVDTRNEENFESHPVNIPFDVLMAIMGFCVGVEYLNFRVTCKRCQLEAPMIRWRNETSQRLQTYSLISPWLIVLDKHRGIITFIDPMFGDKYFITTPPELIGDFQICYSRYGWLLLFKCVGPIEMVFFNPFTYKLIKLPDGPHDIDSFCFQNPPTSPDCVIVGFSTLDIFVYMPSSSQQSWTSFHLSTPPHSFAFPTFYGPDICVLNQGALHVFLEHKEEGRYGERVVAEAPRVGTSTQYFLVNCDQHLLLVVMDELGEFLEVFKLNIPTREWEKIDSLGRHMIYICGTTCLYMEAKTPEMENKIYFPRLDSQNGKIMFYSLETCRYHTFNGRNIQHRLRGFFGTKYHVQSYAWIEPRWS